MLTGAQSRRPSLSHRVACHVCNAPDRRFGGPRTPLDSGWSPCTRPQTTDEWESTAKCHGPYICYHKCAFRDMITLIVVVFNQYVRKTCGTNIRRRYNESNPYDVPNGSGGCHLSPFMIQDGRVDYGFLKTHRYNSFTMASKYGRDSRSAISGSRLLPITRSISSWALR